jgi:hypothetical protein
MVYAAPAFTRYNACAVPNPFVARQTLYVEAGDLTFVGLFTLMRVYAAGNGRPHYILSAVSDFSFTAASQAFQRHRAPASLVEFKGYQYWCGYQVLVEQIKHPGAKGVLEMPLSDNAAPSECSTGRPFFRSADALVGLLSSHARFNEGSRKAGQVIAV